MAVGAAVATANSFLGVLRGTAYTGVTAQYVQLHDGDPGAAGSANISAMTTRNVLTHNVPANGAMTMATLPSFTMTATESISHLSVWSAATGGTFLYSAVLTAARSVNASDTLTFNTLTVSLAPIAA